MQSMGLRKKIKETKSIRNNYSKGELAKEILKAVAIGSVAVASITLPSNLPQVLNFFGVESSRNRFRAKRAILALKKKNLIDLYEKGDRQILEITEGGKKRVLEYKLDEMKIERPKKWDGYWRMISFDIPEKYKKARNALTSKLKDMEIYPLHKSVFICPFEFKNQIDFIGEVFDVRKFINYFLVKNLDDDQENYLKQYYALKTENVKKKDD